MVRTDHQCLKQLLTNGIEGGAAACRVIRYATKLLQYNFQVQYIPGKPNPVADALSLECLTRTKIPEWNFCNFVKSTGLWPTSFDSRRTDPGDWSGSSATKSSETHRFGPAITNFDGAEWDSWILECAEWSFHCQRRHLPAWKIRDPFKPIIETSCFRPWRSKCKSRLREIYWWPNLNSSVEDQIRSYPCCY